MDILKIATAGSVDDGKSTLIGRLLYETNSLKKDQIEHIQSRSKLRGFDHLDFSLATDGLLTEREQGITIDVSNIFFSTPKRRFIIADSPGHIEYTRNMVTGASTSAATIILIDARKGVIEQTKRHYYITQLLKIKQVVFAINKMDLVNYDESRFNEIQEQLNSLIKSNEHQTDVTYHFVPISALLGDFVVENSKNLEWYKGKPLLTILEQLPNNTSSGTESVFQVQYVIRPKTEAYHDYRGFAGKLKSGTIKQGDAVKVYPSKRSSYIKRIEKYGSEVNSLNAGENGTLLLTDELDISRGNSIVGLKSQLNVGKNVEAKICWMQNEELETGKKYWMQQGVQRVLAKVQKVHNKIDLDSFIAENTTQLSLNDIGEASIVTAEPLISKSYKTNKELGAFILIDPLTNNTAGVGFIN
jgi:sulfate adenylyltransferase subunit 1